MIKIVVCFILLASPLPLLAAGLDTPVLSPPLATARFFDPERLLTTAGIRYQAAGALTLEPELGLGYRALERDLQGGAAEEIHKVHAQAGWRLSLADALYLSAAAKLPVYSYQRSGSYWGQSLGSRQEYDLVHSLREIPAWTGEMGVHLGSRADLTLYYDQAPVPRALTGLHQQEERIGTRIIWHFE